MNTHYLDPKTLKKLGNFLKKSKDEAQAGLDDVLKNIGDDLDTQSDIGDQASNETGTLNKIFDINRRRKFLARIDLMLNKISDGSYGYCSECDNEIGEGRMVARPTALLCIDCKTVAEIREKQVGKAEGRSGNKITEIDEE